MKSQLFSIPAVLEKKYLSTATLAQRMDCLAASIRTSVWRHGHFYGVKPIKLPGGKSARLLWPADAVERILESCGEVA